MGSGESDLEMRLFGVAGLLPSGDLSRTLFLLLEGVLLAESSDLADNGLLFIESKERLDNGLAGEESNLETLRLFDIRRRLSETNFEVEIKGEDLTLSHQMYQG